jgi:hypothetical protein
MLYPIIKPFLPYPTLTRYGTEFTIIPIERLFNRLWETRLDVEKSLSVSKSIFTLHPSNVLEVDKMIILKWIFKK